MRKKRILLFLLLLFSASSMFSQTILDSLRKKEQGKGVVTITQSAAIDTLVNGKNMPQTKPKTAETVKGKDGEKKVGTGTSEDGNAAKNPQDKEDSDEEAEKPEAKKETTYRSVIPNGGLNESTGEVDRRPKMIQARRKVQGYRIQVYAGPGNRTGKVGAHNAANRVKSAFPSIDVYPHFQAPRWRCLVGSFRTMGEANAMLSRLKKAGFSSAAVVKDWISVR